MSTPSPASPETISNSGSNRSISRRKFFQTASICGLALLPNAAPLRAAATRKSKSAALLGKLKTASFHKRVAWLQELYEGVAFHESGIIYSMQRLDAEGVRPFVAADFEGQIGINPSVARLQLAGPWDYLHGENSISASGLYLAAQSYRHQVTNSKAALAQARKAFRSLELIYQMGVAAGKPGWMCKPYGFRPSPQTSGDQYLDACWGLWTFHQIASGDERRRIEQMFISFADYWKSVDYVLSYFGSHWDQKGETGAYNAVYAMINACAYSFSRSPRHLREFERWMRTATWPTTTVIASLRSKALQHRKQTGEIKAVPYSAAYSLAKDLLKPGEILCWETVIHAKFVTVAADLIVQSKISDLSGKLGEITRRWWSEWTYGMDENFLGYYWFAVDLVNDTWRPLPRTKLLPKERWLFGDPFTSYISAVRWNEPLCRFILASVISAQSNPDENIKRVAHRMMASLDPTHLHWIVDVDGEQLLPELKYYGHCLSSEAPGSFLAAYWKGRKDRLW
jgi:hypothetical protein